MDPRNEHMEPAQRDSPQSNSRIAEQTNPFSKVNREPAPIVGGDVSPVLHWAFRQLYPDTRFRLRAKGGEHLVIEFDDFEGSAETFSIGERAYRKDVVKPKAEVIKVDYWTTLHAMKPLLDAPPEEEDTARKESRRILREVAAERKQRLAELANPKYLGPEAMLKERYFIRDVPISASLIQALNQTVQKERNRELGSTPALLVVQERIDIDPEESVSLHGPYPEFKKRLRGALSDDAKQTYAEAHALCLGEDVPMIESNEPWQLACHLFPNLVSVSSRVWSDPAFASCLRDVVHRVIAFISDTGKMLDFAGSNNFLMVHGERPDSWQVKAVDPLAMQEETMQDLKENVARIESDEKLSEPMLVHVKNELNTIRVVNALAVISGSSERLRVDGLNRIPAETWRQML